MDKFINHALYIAFICFLPFWIIVFSWQVGWVYVPLLANKDSFGKDQFIVTSQHRQAKVVNGKYDYTIRGYRASDRVKASLSWRGGSIFNQRYGVWNEGDTIPIWSSKMVPAKYMVERDAEKIPSSAFQEIWKKLILQTIGIVGAIVLLSWLIKKYRKILQGKDE